MHSASNSANILKNSHLFSSILIESVFHIITQIAEYSISIEASEFDLSNVATLNWITWSETIVETAQRNEETSISLKYFLLINTTSGRYDFNDKENEDCLSK